MEQTKALNALEPFLALTKSANSPRAAADLIARATSAQNTYIFTSLLEAPQIQALSTSEQVSALRLLEIFSYGTYSDYTTASTPLPDLNPAQLLKLRQLSLLALAKDPTNLTYSTLASTLGLSSKKELEDLVISAIYAGLLEATLDPQHQTVLVSSVAPLRDVAPSTIATMISTLKEWEFRCSETLSSLELQIKTIRAEAAKRASADKAWNEKVEKLIDKANTSFTQAPNNGKGVGGENGQHWENHGTGRSSLTDRLDGNKRAYSGDSKSTPTVLSGDSDDEGMDVDYDDEDASDRLVPGKGAKKRGHGGMH